MRARTLTRSPELGLADAQLAAIGELVKLSERDELVLVLRGGLDGSVIATMRDRYTVEHFAIDHLGTIRRPARRLEVPQV